MFVTDDVYLRNMAAIWRVDPRLAHAIDQLPIDASLTLEPSRAGPPTALVVTPDGRPLYLHSRYDPVAEAEQFCRTQTEADSQALVAVLCGLGLGYHVSPLQRQLGGDGVVIAVEPDLVTIKSALACHNFDDAILMNRLVFLTSDDKAELHARLDPHAAVMMLGTRFVAPPALRPLNVAFQQRVRGLLTEYAAYSKMSLVTLVANARITCANIANNLPFYVSTPPIDRLRGRFAGRPAVLVAAGPSLGRNVEQLRAVRDRVEIIAVQTTLKPLLARGITPDFVTSLDFSDLSRRFFESVSADGVYLVAEPKASWQVIDAFMGGPPGARDRPSRRLSLLDNLFARRCLGDDLAARGGLRAGSTVAHLAFYLAEYLGCDPIILLGQDLGFSGGVYYTPGVTIHDAWRPELGRFATLEMKEWERIARMRPILRRATDVFDRPIYTDEQMFTYLQQFERDFAACSARVIDATEGGVRKAGTTIMPLAEALRQFACEPLDAVARCSGGPAYASDSTIASAEAVVHDAAALDAKRLPAAAIALRKRLAELSEFRGLCTQTRDLLAEMERLLDRPAEFDRRIVRVDELREMVFARGLIFQMVSDVSQLAELQKFSADRRLASDQSRAAAGSEMSPVDRARRQLARDRRFVDALLEGCAALQEILDCAVRRTEAMMAELSAREA